MRKKAIIFSYASFIYELIRIYKDRRECLNKYLYLQYCNDHAKH